MSIIFCDYCNLAVSPSEWDGSFTVEGEAVCTQCEEDGMMAASLAFERL
jgi:hypothetical protein